MDLGLPVLVEGYVTLVAVPVVDQHRRGVAQLGKVALELAAREPGQHPRQRRMPLFKPPNMSFEDAPFFWSFALFPHFPFSFLQNLLFLRELDISLSLMAFFSSASLLNTY